MTQTPDSVRLRVVEGEPPTATETLATQIYTTYVASEGKDDPDKLPAATLEESDDLEATDATPLPTEDASEPADTPPDRPPSQRTLDLPTLPPRPPSARDRAPHRLATTPTIAQPRATTPVLSALTDEEAALLHEVLGEKFDAAQVQRLIQTIHDATPGGVAKTHPIPLAPRTVNRYRLAAGVLILMLLGVGSSLVLNRTTGKGLVLPNAPQATATATPSVAGTPVPQLDATLTSRNVALDAALKESEGQRDALDRTRRDYLLALADAEVKQNGTPVEVWLIRRLNTQMLELRRALGQGGQFSGDAQQIGMARALVGDARAILLALQQEWQTPNAAPGRHRIAPAILAKQMTELAELARMVREASYEQQLRDAERAQPPERKRSQQEVPTNGVLPTP